MSTWKKYLLLQIPGWLGTASVVALLWHWQFLPAWLAWLCVIGWFIKDLAMYPILRRAYEDGAETGSAALIGARGVAQEELNPNGYIRVRGELWRAALMDSNQSVGAGTEVEIVNAERMLLRVRPVRKSEQKRREII